MAKIAILGSSYSTALLEYKEVPNDYLTGIDIENDWEQISLRLNKIHENKSHNMEDHWVNLLAQQFPQHSFHVYATEGAGWQIAEMVLKEIVDSADRVIVELQNYRVNWPILESTMKDNEKPVRMIEELRCQYVNGRYLIDSIHSPYYHSRKGDVTYYEISQYGFPTMYFDFHVRDNSFEALKESQSRAIDMNFQMFKKWSKSTGEEPLLFKNINAHNMFHEFINRAEVVLEYEQYLNSLINLWPKVYEHVGVWAYCDYSIPWRKMKYHEKLPHRREETFEWASIEKWIREDPLNNTYDSWKFKYYGADLGHLKKESMHLLVEFLLEQPSIRQVLYN